MEPPSGGDLTREEDELYDRQIRVWGVDTQCALRAARILVVVVAVEGELGVQQVLAAEIVKNLALAGIGFLHIHFFGGKGTSCNLSFLGQSVEEVEATLLDMNDRLKLRVTHGKEKDAYLGQQSRGEGETAGLTNRYTVALVLGKELQNLNRISVDLVEDQSKADVLFAAGVKGGCGFAFSDNGSDSKGAEGGEANAGVVARRCKTCLATIGKSFQVPVSDLPRRANKLYAVLRVIYMFESEHHRSPTLKDLDAVMQLVEAEIEMEKQRPSKELLENFLETASEMPAVSAVVGGSLAQEVIKSISGKGQLMNNFYLFSAYGSQDSGEAKVELIPLPKQ